MISVVTPAFNEEQALPALYQRLTAAAQAWQEDYEIIVVDDGSRDNTLAVCAAFAARDPRFKTISLSRNFGHQAAITAGLDHARGDFVAIIDADLQDPPEVILTFLNHCRSGFDVVYAIRTKRKENIWKRASYFLYYRLLRRLATLDIPLDSGDFCIMRREVVDALCRLPETNRFVRGLRTWVGFRQTGLAYERHARFAGKPQYTFRKLLKLALDGLFNFSYRPLQSIMFLGIGMAAVAGLAAALVLFLYLTNSSIANYNPRQAQGWTSLMIGLLLLGALQLICLGVIGEYLGRLFEEVKRRPVYLVKQRLNLEPPQPSV